jgi:dCTP deaminase
MTVLTRDVLLEEIAKQRIRIEPLEPGQIGPASIDLTLGDEIRVIERGSEPIRIRDDVDYRDHTRLASLAAPYVLAPGATIHGITGCWRDAAASRGSA